MSGRFDGRVAIVTGASSGIGLAVAERLGIEGARLVVIGAPADHVDLDTALAGLRERGIAAEGCAADVADAATAERAVTLALSHFGRLDILINNAGIAYFESVLETPLDHLDRTLAVNVRGMFALSLRAAREMSQHGHGVIVNTASTAAFAGEEFQATYNAAKGAVVALTRSLAVDLAPLGIRVNAVAPGWVATRSTQAILADPVQWSKHRSRIPLDRPATPAEVAAVHAFLASDDASYVTGSIYLCDGGLTAGYRYSNWAAIEPPPEGWSIGLPDVPANLGHPIS